MAKKQNAAKSRKSSGVVATGTKLNRVSVKGSSGVKGGNSGGTKDAGPQQVAGNSHHGDSLGKRNSG